MNTCATCRFWDVKGNHAHGPAVGDCNEPHHDYFPVPEHLAGACVPVDAEGYSGYIETGPNYGCVHWQAYQDAGLPDHTPS